MTCDVTAIFFKNDFIFEITAQALQIMHLGLIFDTESQNALVKLVMSQKRLKIGQKKLLF